MKDKTRIYYTYATKRELYGVGADPEKVYENVTENGLQQAELTDEQCRLLHEG